MSHRRTASTLIDGSGRASGASNHCEYLSRGPSRLPDRVMTSLVKDLDRLETLTSPDARRLTELLRDTGRRPNELCRLPWDCLTTGEDGKWVLVWTNFKSNRSDRHLPIHDSTAKSIQAQQVAVRERFPHTDTAVLSLFPRERANPDGLFQITPGMYAAQHKRWVRSFPETHCVTTESSDGTKAIERMAAFVDDANMPFDCDRITPYAYRHTYCQRHADQGTAPEVLRELLDHRSMETTQGYYEVRERRLRVAVNRVYSAQVTGRGETLWDRAIESIDDATRTRLRIGETAVPYGVCTEPTNVKAAGTACPYKFTCIACSHFRTDPSYLPELMAYHDRLIETRARVRAATDIEDWAKDKVTPADEEITAISELIQQLEHGSTRLSDADRELLDRAVRLVRDARRQVDLGLPTSRDIRGVETR